MKDKAKKDARRVGAVVKLTERRPRNRPEVRGRFPSGGGAYLIPAQTTTTVAGGSLSSPTSTTLNLLKWDDSAGSLVTNGKTVTALNAYANASPIAASKLVWITYFGKWFIVAADCG